tara:strand:+ start:2396 stop:2812 length:417 start_codon:yes stop_codon:yes gene_type:complete
MDTFISRMSVNYWKKEAEKAKRASKFAWGQYFQVRNELFESQLGIYNETDLLIFNEEMPEEMDEHLQKFISDLYKKSKSYVECSICLEVITAETLETTPCGHNFHKDCLNKLKQTKEVGKKTVPCPMCRKDLWCIKSK